MSSPKYATNCVERFLEYVKIDTQSCEDSDTFPSTSTQLDLLRQLPERTPGARAGGRHDG